MGSQDQAENKENASNTATAPASESGRGPGKSRSILIIVFGMIISTLVAVSLIYRQTKEPTTTRPLLTTTSLSNIANSGSPAEETKPQATTAASQPDLTVDGNGLSKATVTIKTTKGIIKFKFYPGDAPKTVHRIIELVNQGFYNGLSFHRVVPGFVIQGGDPQGNGTGGSGQKLEPEFNNRNHVEGTVAMARAADPASADSQFYISLGVHPHLDHQYTIFGYVVEGLDVAKQIVVGDKMETVSIQ